MKAVNLLPEKDRPRVASGARSGSAYVVLGVLGLGLLALVAIVVTANQASSARAETVQAKKETDAAQAKVARLGSFGSFTQMKKTRVASVKSLASERFDWERLALEMSRVTPPRVFIKEIDATTTGDSDSSTGGSSGSSASSTPPPSAPSGGSGSSSASSSSGGPAGAAGASPAAKPTMTLIGCAEDQRDVATTMVRLRLLHRAEEVKLTESIRETATPNPASGGASSTGAPAPAGAAAEDSADGCGATGGRPNYKFTVDITFTVADEKTSKGSVRAPAALGGGS